jgi:TIR domain
MFTYETEVWVAVVLFVVLLFGAWYVVWRLLEQVMVPRVFISYRRKDRPEVARRIYRELEEAYGEGTVIFDVSTQEGLPYDEVLGGGLASSDIIVAVIGPHWDGRERQEDTPRILLRNDDWVRREVRHGLKPPNNMICVRAIGPKDKIPPEVPRYTKTQLDAWEATLEERADLEVWLEEFRKQTALTVAIDEADNLGGFNELKSRIDRRHQGTGRRWLIAWKWGGGLVTTAIAVLLIGVVGPGVADIRPRAAELKKTTDDLEDRTTKTEKTLGNLDGVVINTLPIEEFAAQWVKDTIQNGDRKRYTYQYVCWKLVLAETTDSWDADKKAFRVVLAQREPPPGASGFRVRAYFDEREYRDQVKGLRQDQVVSLTVSGRIEAVDQDGVLLRKCRVVVGRPLKTP